MIWTSVPLMTVFDILIVAVAAYSLAVLLHRRTRLSQPEAAMGFISIVSGLTLIALFYFADLLTMHALPWVTTPIRAMAVMRDMHLNYSWFIVLLGVASITFGFSSVGKHMLVLVESLQASESRLSKELTERARMERDLGESERRIRAFFANVPSFIYQKGRDLRLTHFNDHYLRFMGLEENELMGKSASDLFPPDKARGFDEEDREILANGTVLNKAVDFTLPDGTLRQSIAVKFPIYGADGEIVGIGGINTDITDLRQAEDALREQRELLASVMTNIPNSVFWKDCDLVYLGCNEHFAALAGLDSASDIVGKTDFDLLWIDEDSERYRSYDRDVIDSGRPMLNFEETQVRPDGTTRIQLTSKVPLMNAEGEIAGVLGIFTDITERKRAEEALSESEERFRGVAEITSDWIWELGPDLRCTWMSGRAEEVMGITAAYFLGKAPRDLGQPDDEHEEWARYLEDISAHRPIRDVQVRRTIDGKQLHQVLNANPLFGPDGAFRGYRGTTRDIAAEVEARQETTRIEERFLNAIENLQGGIALFDADERLLFCNRRFKTRFGAAGDHSVSGATYEDIIRARVKYGYLPNWAVGQEEQWIEKRLRQFREPAGSNEYPMGQAWLQVHHERLPDGSTIVIGSDITELKEREEKLRESEERFRDMAESASDWFWEMGPDLRFTYHSERYFEITGFRPEEKIGTTRTRYVDPTDREADAEKWAAHLAGLEAHKPFKNFEYSFVSSTGRVCHVRISGTPFFDADGEFLGYRGTGTDITERKRAEEALSESEARLKAIIDHAPLFIYLKDLDGRYILVNRRFAKAFNLSAEELLGETTHEVLPEAFADKMIQQDAEVLATGAVTQNELTLTGKDGTTVIMNSIKFPVFGTEGDIVAIGGFSIDLTEQKQRDEVLRQAQKMEAVGQLTGGVAHDFNNLLMVVLGNLEMARDDLGDNSDVSTLVDRASAAAERGAALTRRLLAFSRKQALMPGIIDLNELVAGMTDLLRRTLGEIVEIETVSADDLWRCEADPSQLENALLNLAINARDAMPEGGKLTVETGNVHLDDDYAAAQADLTPGQYVMVAVTDTGAGMPPEVIDHAFEPFFTTKEVGSGSGLGLSMIYGYVKQSDGHVTIYSEEGVGTTVKMYLPRSLAGAEEAQHEEHETEPRARGETILVVEDDPDVRALAVALLGDLGYEILEAADGETALTALDHTSRVDLLFTDVVLPGGMSGPNLAEEVKRRVPGVSVVFMSGYTDNAIIHQGRLDKGVELLNKPFRKVDLAQKVRSVLDKPDL